MTVTSLSRSIRNPAVGRLLLQTHVAHGSASAVRRDSDDQTLVTPDYDWSAVIDAQLLATMPRVSREDLTRSLDRLAAAL
ncbi:MAG: hypothetical protein ACRDQU_02065 [Pseudonocardiaceae bacterium]